jgi:hypothetical protein
MNRSGNHEPQLKKSLRLELTIILNLEDLLKPIELDQKPWNEHTKCV